MKLTNNMSSVIENTCHRYQQKYKNEEMELFTCDLQFKANKLAGNL